MKKLFTLLFLAISLSMFAEETINVGGKNRTMIVYAPQNLPANAPLMISMHGMNQDAAYQQSQAKWKDIADTAKFVVVYPNGEGKGWDLGSSKDLDFLQAIINTMKQRYNINTNRVYLNGFSMGGMMTYYTLRNRPTMCAAYAPVSGYPMDQSTSRPNGVNDAVPIIHTHGTGDDVCRYDPVPNYVKRWAEIDGCNLTPRVVQRNSGTKFYQYRGGRNGTEVWLLEFQGKGHWFSNDVNFALTNQEVWNFCKRFERGKAPNNSGGSSYVEVTTVPNGETSIGATNYRTWNGVGANASAIAVIDNNYSEKAS
nr:dienelactone hydrolase family protein [Bacteroidaceae bacterium]